MTRLFDGDGDFIPGQPILRRVIAFYDGITVSEHWKKATFKGRDAGGHAIIEYDDGSLEKLQTDADLRG